MKNALVIALALFTVATSAQAANLSGKWTGKGTAVDHQGKQIPCESVVLTITHSASSFSVNSDFLCGGNKINIPGGAMEVRGNELFDKGVKAGTISDSAVSLVATANGFIMQSNASFTASAMNLRSVISLTSKPANPVLTFEAALKR